MKSFKNVTVTLLCILLSSCGDDSPSAPSEDRLTPITSVGANTFSCRVNGQIWIPFKDGNPLEGDISIFSFLDPNPNINVMELRISAERTRSENLSGNFDKTSFIHIYIDSINSTGSYPINWFNEDNSFKTPGSRKTLISTDGMKGMNGYAGQGIGVVNITTLDTINKIVSGTFNYRAPKSNGGELIITDGRFDLKIE